MTTVEAIGKNFRRQKRMLMFVIFNSLKRPLIMLVKFKVIQSVRESQTTNLGVGFT